MEHEQLYDILYSYLTKGVYPSEYSTNKKRSLRRKAEHYSVENGDLFYVGGKNGHKRRVIKNEDEMKRILENCHAQTEGIAYNSVRSYSMYSHVLSMQEATLVGTKR